MKGPLLVLLLRLCITAWTYPTSKRDVSDANSSHRWRRLGRTILHQHNEQVSQQLERDDVVSAILHYVELTHNRSDSHHCTRTSLAHLYYELSNQSYDLFSTEILTAVKTANFLTTLFLKTDNFRQLLHNEEFYYAIVKLNVRSEQQVFGSAIAFRRGKFRPEDTLFCPFAYKQGTTVITKNLAQSYERPYDDPKWIGNDWFSKQAAKNYTEFLFSKSNDYDLYSSFKDAKSDVFVGPEDGIWSSPYYDCGGSNAWVVTYSVPFFRRNDRIEFSGVVTLSFDLRNVDINQCDEDDSLFAGTHKCDTLTTTCVPVSGLGFRRGGYECHCRKGFYYSANGSSNVSQATGFSGLLIESMANHINERSGYGVYPDDFRCLPCKPGCQSCVDGTPCFVEYNMILRSLILGFQGFCTTISIVLAVVVFRLRKSKIIASARWVKLETILFGSLLIYQTVIIRYFEPTNATCIIEPWFRELGFAICYGAIVLKIYRILAEFQTRKAHRVCVRDKDLLKYLCGIVMVVVGYMAAWTAVVMDNVRRGHSILDEGQTTGGLRYYLCRSLWWDYVTEIGEFLFLLLGIYLTYCVRNARNDYFREKCALCWSLYIEAVMSLIMNTIRHVIWLQLDPDFIFLMYFLRCQLTITIMMALIFGPKLWYYNHPPTSAEHTRHYSSSEVHDHVPEGLKLHDAIMSSTEVDFTEINLSEMDPEDIRAELRRVYTQLQILRNKTMRKDNPHISKRRGGRKVTHRRFSLQPFHHKHKHHHDHDHEATEVSKTPEESTASIEGTIPFQPETRTDENSGKSSHK